MAAATDITDIVSDLTNVAPAGFAMAFHIRFTTPTFLLQSYPAEWIAYYSQNGLVMQDPTVHWGFENTGSIAWSDLVDRDPSGVIAQAATHGMRHGMTLAVNQSGSLSVTSFARADRPFDPHEQKRIKIGVNAIHDATIALDALDPDLVDALRKLSVTATSTGT